MLQQVVAFLLSLRDLKAMLPALLTSLGLGAAPARGRGAKKLALRGS